MQNIISKAQPGRHYLVWCVSGFATGIFFYMTTPILNRTSFCMLSIYSFCFALLSLTMILTCIFIRKSYAVVFSDMILVAAIFISFILGIFRTAYYDDIQFRAIQTAEETEKQYVGVMTDKPAITADEDSMMFPVKILGYYENEMVVGARCNVIAYADKELCEGFSEESVIEFSAILREPHRESFYGGFSSKSYLYSQGYRYTANIDDYMTYSDYPPPENPIYLLMVAGRKIRNHILNCIDAMFEEKNEEAALLKGLILGFKDDFTDKQYESYINSGFVHIVAVSGMHISIMFGFLWTFLRKFRICNRLVYMIIFPVLLLFSAAAEFTASVSRAVISVAMTMVATLIKREHEPLTTLAFSAAVLLAVNPYILKSYSFILSFGATAGIIVLSAPIQKCCMKIVKSFVNPEGKVQNQKHSLTYNILTKTVLSSAILSVSAQLGVGYFSARFFNKFNFGSIMGNIFIIPVSTAAFVFGFILTILQPLMPYTASVLARYPLRLMLYLTNRITELFALPVFRLYIPTLPMSAFVIYFVLIYVLYYYLNRYAKD